MRGPGSLPRSRRSQKLRLPSNIKLLKTILDQYPDDGQIIKELVQNADDAGARQVRLLLDESSYPVGKLLVGDLRHYQGPSLLAFNDAKFAEKDFEGMRTFYESVKENNPMKVGRFGLGFKSVFHITDLVSYVSVETVGFLDPHERHFTDEDGKSAFCYDFDFETHADKVESYADQWKPYCHTIFNLDRSTFNRKRYDHTLFRFPLRHADCRSEISDKTYSVEDVLKLFTSVALEGHLYLLFLQKVEEIELYRKKAGDQQPQLVYRVALSDSCRENIREMRDKFFQSLNKAAHDISYTMDIDITKISQNGHATTTTKSYLVCQYQDYTAMKRAPGLKPNRPLVGAALPVAEGQDRDLVHDGGHLFCFLPLPLATKSLTGCGVHINGAFAVNQNRRYIKLPSSDQKTGFSVGPSRDDAIKWNFFLMADLLPKCLAILTKEVARKILQGEVEPSKLYEMFPLWNQLCDYWNECIYNRFYEAVAGKEVFYTRAQGGKLVALKDAWLMVDRHGLPDDVLVERILLEESVNLVKIPNDLLKERSQCRFTAALVKTWSYDLLAKCLRKQQDKEAFDQNELRLLLGMFLSSPSSRKFLVGLRLLPTLGGRWQMWNPPTPPFVYLESPNHPAGLLPDAGQGKIFDMSRLDNRSFENIKQLIQEKTTQLRSFNAEALCQELKAYFEHSQPQLTMDWYKKLWEYILSSFRDSLGQLEGLPIVPAVDRNGVNGVGSLKSSVVVVIIKDQQHRADMFEAVGMKAMQSIPKFVLDHPNAKNYFFTLEALPTALLKLRSVVGDELLEERFERMSVELKAQWREQLLLLAQQDNGIKALLKNLPIFPLYPNIEGVEFARPGDVGRVVPHNVTLRIPIPEQFLLQENGSNVAKILDLRVLPRAMFLTKHLIPASAKMEKEQVEEIARFALNKYSDLESEGKEMFVTAMKKFKFLSATNSSELHSAKDLLDPLDKELYAVMHTTCLFPVGDFVENYNDKLKILGLRGEKDVTDREITKVAQHIHDLAAKIESGKSKNKKHETKECEELSRKFFKLLRNLYKTSGHISIAVDLNWVPVDRNPPNEYPKGLPWFGANFLTTSPTNVVDNSMALICGSVRCVTKTGGFFRLKEPTDTDFLNHFKAIVEAKKGKVNGLTDVYRRTLEKLSALDVKGIGKSINSAAWVLVEEELVEPGRIILHSDIGLSLKPYLFANPSNLKDLAKILEDHGAEKELSQRLLVSVLDRMFGQFGEDTCLDGHSLGVIKSVVRLISDLKPTEKLDEQLAGHYVKKVFLPNKLGYLRPMKELMYDQTPWFEEAEASEYCHLDIPYPQAKYLGVRNTTEVTMEKFSLGIPFGQKERLTTRLQGILRGYPWGSTVIKELLQNADDAGASLVHLVLDRRTHKADKVFNTGWENLQGPALLVYNDKHFTDKDMKGIEDLGQGSKRDDPLRTGQYGVGFNSVYHLTDTPTFITTVVDEKLKSGETRSRKYLCAFDPNACDPQRMSVYGANAEWPGREFAVDEFKNKFIDVFQPYMLDDFDTDSGTLFRFPLRSEAQAKTSEILNEPRTPDDIMKLFRAFFDSEADQCLLFLKHVRAIEVSMIETDGTRRQMHSVRAAVADEQERKVREAYSEKFLDYMSRLKAGQFLKEAGSGDVRYHLHVDVTSGPTQTSRNWVVVRQFGFRDPNNVPMDLAMSYQKGKIMQCPEGGVAYSSEYSTSRELSKVFCLLPLKQSTRLPFHVNAHFFLNSETRDALIPSETSKEYHAWNELVLREIVASAAVKLLQELVFQWSSSSVQEDEEVEARIKEFLSVFPRVTRESAMITMQERFYSVLAFEEGVRVLPIVMPRKEERGRRLKWISVSEAVFDSDRGSTPKELGDVLRRCGLRLLPSTKELRSIEEQLKHLKSPLKNLCFDVVASHLKRQKPLDEFVGEPLEESPVRNMAGMIAICNFLAKDFVHHPSEFTRRLANVPLLVSQDGTLKPLLSGTLFEPTFGELFPRSAEKFLHKDLEEVFKKFKVCKKLCLLEVRGMLEAELDAQVWKSGKEIAVNVDQDKNFAADICRDSFDLLWRCLDDCMGAKDRNVYAQLVKIVGDWSVYPCIHNDKTLLIPLSKASSVCCVEGEHFVGRDILDAFKELPFRAPARNVFAIGKFVLYDALLGGITKPESVIDSLLELMLTDEATDVIKKHHKALLKYFSNYLAGGNLDLEPIKKLPVFETVSGEIVSVAGRDPRVLRSNFPESNLPQDENIVFVRADREFEALYSSLEFKTVTDGSVYSDLILPRFESFSDAEKKSHAAYLKDYCNRREPDHENLLRMLRTMKVFRNKSSRFVRASDLCSPKKRLFATFRPDDIVPDEYLGDDGWLKFMNDLGLKQEIIGSELQEFATRLAADPSAFGKEAVKEIVDELFAQNDMDTLKGVSRIEFLPRNQSSLVLLLDSRPKALSYTCFHDAVFADNSSLCWSQRSVISETLRPPNRQLLAHLGVNETVPEEIIIAHLDNVSQRVSSAANQESVSAEYIKELEAAFTKLRERSLSPQTLTTLSKLPLLPINNVQESSRSIMMVSTSSIVLNGLTTEDSIPPVLMPFTALPSQLLQFQGLFQRMGAYSEIRLECYADVLNETGNAATDQVVDTAFKGMIALLYRGKHFHNKPAQLLMPSKDGRMISSSRLTFVDNVRLRKRIAGEDIGPELKEYNFSGLSVKAALRNLPDELRPKFLSDQVKEVVDRQNIQETTMGEVAEKIKLRFSDERFAAALYHTLLSSSAVETPKETVTKIINSKIITVGALKTILRKNGVEIKNSKNQVDFFIEENSYDNMFTLFVTNHCNDSNVAFELLRSNLSSRISRALSLKSEETDELRDVFMLSIAAIPMAMEARGVSLVSDAFFPCCGSAVPVERQNMMVLQMVDIPVGEYVAFQQKPLDFEDVTSADYVYARVVGCVTASSDPMKKEYKIETESGVPRSARAPFLYMLKDRAIEENDQNDVKDALDEMLSTLREAHRTFGTSNKSVFEQVFVRLLQRCYSLQKNNCEDVDQIVGALESLKNDLDASSKATTPTVVTAVRQHIRSVPTKTSTRTTAPRLKCPNRGLAARMLRQAMRDLAAAPNDMADSTQAYDWACNKSQQAAEKALKAVLYCDDYTDINTEHNLDNILPSGVASPELRGLASRLQFHLGHLNGIRYPSTFGSGIPADNFHLAEAETALSLATQIVDACKPIVFDV